MINNRYYTPEKVRHRTPQTASESRSGASQGVTARYAFYGDLPGKPSCHQPAKSDG